MRRCAPSSNTRRRRLCRARGHQQGTHEHQAPGTRQRFPARAGPLEAQPMGRGCAPFCKPEAAAETGLVSSVSCSGFSVAELLMALVPGASYAVAGGCLDAASGSGKGNATWSRALLRAQLLCHLLAASHSKLGPAAWCGEADLANRGFVALGVPIGSTDFVRRSLEKRPERLHPMSRQKAEICFVAGRDRQLAFLTRPIASASSPASAPMPAHCAALTVR